MATLTPNYGLSKPDDTDNFSNFRQSYNDNMDKIDANMGGGGGGGGNTYYGVFIDTSNEIVSKTTYNSAVGLTYTATQDCVVCADLISNGNTFPNVTIDNKWIGLQFQNTLQQTTYQFFLKKGQTLNISASVSDNVNYVVYGLVGGSSGGGGSYTAGDGIDITSNVISLEYLTVNNGKVCLVFDDGT